MVGLISYQTQSEEDGEQHQADAHRDEQSEHKGPVLLAHAVEGLIEPVTGAGQCVLLAGHLL